MLKSHGKFHSTNGKRLVLIAEDEMINREMLTYMIGNEYEIIYAEDGRQALEQLRAHALTLSLVLLDLMMPGMTGMELLRRKKEEPEIASIPVIVMTADHKSEAESLTLGAIDFIPKPYPTANVVLARMARIIELFEDRQTITLTERDPLTNLYTKEYFFRYAEQYDQFHPEQAMDALVIDINHFRMINERFGKNYGDEVLRRTGERIRELVSADGGMVCRREADTFLVYCPGGKDYRTIMEEAAIGLSGAQDGTGRVHLRMGVYSGVDKTMNIERRFDRAKTAADTVRGSFVKNIGIYDDDLHEKELYAERLIEEFHKAIEEKQFVVYYQPKFDIRSDIPVLASAEALVRWQHPQLGMISPGVFIPLFENNGLIQPLDHYVWRMAASQVRSWKERFGITVPVSVNVSRIDMYDPFLVETLQGILTENDLTADALRLEITETAYTQDSRQMIETVNRLRDLGFLIEMDDFGTGYSSLNMISKLPVDALKLDMQFIRAAFSQGMDTRMLEVIIEIADYLSVPTIAEGVETEEQLLVLKAMGCDLVQGFYFSRPVPAGEYEQFITEKLEWMKAEGFSEVSEQEKPDVSQDFFMGSIAHSLSSGFERIYDIDLETDHYVEFTSEGKDEDLQIARSGEQFFDDMRKDITRCVCPDDQERLLASLGKEALLAQLNKNQHVSLTYRLMENEHTVFYTLKVVRSGIWDGNHIVIGVSNIDEQMRPFDQEGSVNALDFGSLAQALSSDMESIYYVDMTTNTYLEYKCVGSYRKLNLETDGKDFFSECQKNILKVVYEDDRVKVSGALDKDTLVQILKEKGIFSMIYRLVIDGQPVYYRLKAVETVTPGGSRLIIGVSNIDSQITEEEKLEAQRQSMVTFSSIAEALSQDYFSIYYVNTENDHFIEYSSDEEYASLNIEKSGDDFFGLSRKNVSRVIHPDDAQMFLEAFTKEKILEQLEQNRTFTLTYRLMFHGVPTYVHLKATRMENRKDRHIVIGVSNVDAQIRREQEHARALLAANRDALTGVKSKLSYAQAEVETSQAIQEGRAEPFAVTVCDVNELKLINDTYGHMAGDQYIKEACMMICHVFKHSPVYRIGGDEFVAVLRGMDYENREELMRELSTRNQEHQQKNKAIVAGGMACYRPGEDQSMADVFERADARMYENKKFLKHN